MMKRLTKKIAGVLAVMLAVGSVQVSAEFSDVNSGAYYAEGVQFMLDQNLTEGYADGTFRPDRTLTRAEAAVFLARFENAKHSVSRSSFPDVPDDHFAKDYIEGAMMAGYIEGFRDGTFRPDERLTREQMAVILDRAYPFETADHPFSDVADSRYSSDAIRGLYGSGIAQGTPDGRFGPGDPIRRGDFSLLMMRTADWYEEFQVREQEALYEELNAQIAEIPELRSAITWEHRDLIEATRTNVVKAIRENGRSDSLNLASLEGAEEVLRTLKEERTEEALSSLRSDYESGHFRSNTLSFNEPFAANHNRGAIESDTTTAFEEGASDMSILVTAPHATSHIRNNDRKLAEIYTGSMAKLLHHYTDVHILYITKETQDVNFYHDVEFKDELARVVEEYEIDLVLDLHGASRSRPFDLDIGTSQGTLATERTVNRLLAATRDQGFEEIFENHTFTASNSANIANFAYNELGTEAVQLEYNGALRDPRNGDLDAFYRTVYSLAEFIILQQGD